MCVAQVVRNYWKNYGPLGQTFLGLAEELTRSQKATEMERERIQGFIDQQELLEKQNFFFMEKQNASFASLLRVCH